MSPSSTITLREREALVALEYRYLTWEKERRKVLVAVDAIEHTGTWSVYDMPVARGAEMGWLVERLAGHDDKLDQAAALARDYHGEQQRYHAGERSEHALADPLPRPVETPAGEIRKHATLARKVARKAESVNDTAPEASRSRVPARPARRTPPPARTPTPTAAIAA
jgi:hypothetical protein